ncbi:MAG TPA: hypothetical protein VIR01_02580 [Pyrinomonadaceae bacterium]
MGLRIRNDDGPLEMERNRFLSRQRRKFSRSDVHMNGRQSSVSGIFQLKIDNPSSKDVTGTARTSPDENETKLDAAFHATLK